MTYRQPRLLDSNLREIARLHPSAISATLCLDPISVATLNLPEGEPPLSVRQFVELYGPMGSLGVYRVAAVATAYGKEQRVSLEHGITTLEDELTAADTELTGSLRDILRAILGSQGVKRWQLGEVEAPGTDYRLSVNRTSALQALLDAAALADGCTLAFDQSATPWTVHLRKLPEAVSSECRVARNTEGVTITMDDSALCTRVYSELLPGGYMEADTVGQWGVVAQTIDLDEAATDAERQQEAKKYLDEHKNPAVSIDVNALMLAGLTGEALDSFRIGDVCRVALPDWGVAMDERIVKMTFPNLVKMPEQVRLTLSTPQKTASASMAAMQNEVRHTSSVVKDQHKHITETDESLKLMAKRISANAEQIALKASADDLAAAQIKLDGLEADMELKVDKDGVIAAINLSPGTATISANKIELNGDTIVQLLLGREINAAKFEGELAQISTVEAARVDVGMGGLILGGKEVAEKAQTVVTALQGLSLQFDTLKYKDHDGVNKTARVVTSVELNVPSTRSLTYLTRS